MSDQQEHGVGVGSDPDLVLPPAVPVGRGSTAGVAVLGHLRIQVGALLRADAGLAVGAEDAVHAARVAARRLRSGLRVYGDLLRDDASARLRPELAWFAGTLSPARDLEVFVRDLHAIDDEHGYADALLPWLRVRHDRALAEAVTSSRSARAETLRAALLDLARAPRFTDEAARRAGRVLAPRVLRADARAAAKLERLRPGDDAELWHGARIGAKRARYAAEVGAAALGRDSQQLARLWTGITEPLGQAQDAVIQRALVLERIDDPAAPLSAGEAFACGVLVATTHERELAAHHSARAVWKESRDEHARLRRSVAS